MGAAVGAFWPGTGMRLFACKSNPKKQNLIYSSGKEKI
jgi:hypothetical protein